MSLLFFHAVPVFLVLFGLNSETWFRRRHPAGRTREWYRRGFKRILVPAWATAAVWWVMVAVLRPPEPMVRITIGLPFWHAIGYLNQIGTSWFVTLIVQFVVVFPLFHWLARRLGVPAFFSICLLVTLWTLIFVHPLRESLGVPGWLVFPPRFFVHVAFGMVLAERVARLGARGALVSAALLVVCYAIQERLWLGSFWRIADRMLELPLTVLLLWVMARLEWIGWLERSLSWLGQHSFGLYLGQMLTHNAFLYRYGGTCDLYGCYEGVFAEFNLWLYTAILLAGSIAWVLIGNKALELNASLRERGYPLPNLAV
jgi:peptidoglycan/LPS O-acetylase OafA/YrhL